MSSEFSDFVAILLRRWTFTYWDYAVYKRIETRAQSRSVMLLNALGCTRNTLISTKRFDYVTWPEGVGESLLAEVVMGIDA
jgi:hypothetical protein